MGSPAPAGGRKPIRVLIVDDSAFMRKALSMMLESDPDVEIVDTARDGADGVEKVLRHKPDIVTMDVEMPRMDGITALREIMAKQPTPVLMVSSITVEGAEATVEALQAGAVDFISKQMSFVSLEITNIKEDLLRKIKSIAATRSRLFRATGPGPRANVPAATSRVRLPHAKLVAIGVSTGGPFALQKVIPRLPADFPQPVVVVQHMPPHFTRSLAERLDGLSPLRVVEAEAGMVLERGTVYIAPGGRHLTFRKRGAVIVLETPDEPAAELHRPSVDVTFRSAHAHFGGRILTAIMTGMGKDGLEGAALIKGSGGRLIAQDEETSVVYGMPRAVVEAGLADAVVPLAEIAPGLCRALGVEASA